MKIVSFVLFILLFGSCVSSKKYQAALSDNDKLKSLIDQCNDELRNCKGSKDDLNSTIANLENTHKTKLEKIQSLEEQIEYLKKNNTNLLERLSDLSIVSKAGAESIAKSLEAMNEKDKYIKDLTSAVSRKDSLNLSLVMNLKKSLGDAPSDDINIEVKKGVVYISLSDKMLFRSGSSTINEQASSTLEKIAKIVNDQNEFDILIEGHTDNVPINTECIADNWDLSTKRATAIARLLQRKYNVDPSRMSAGGRSEYLPKSSNDTEQGRQSNRRTEIIIMPRLDQFFQLIKP